MLPLLIYLEHVEYVHKIDSASLMQQTIFEIRLHLRERLLAVDFRRLNNLSSS